MGRHRELPGLDTDGLTPREKECLALALQGLSDKEIATRMGVVPATVDMFLRNCRVKAALAG